MAVAKIKATYSLDVETVGMLERLAKRTRTSKSEALRRAIRLAADAELPPGEEQLDALDELQQSLGLTPTELRRWESETEGLRKGSSRL